VESVSDRLKVARASLLAASGEGIAEALNAAIRQFLPVPFVVGSKDLADHEGTRVPALACTIYLPSTAVGAAESGDIPADSVAVAIEVRETMDLESLRAAYAKVAAAKALKIRPLRADSTDPGVIMGLVFALRAAAPMEDFAAALEALNATTPSEQWPDAIVFAATGVINYAVQFPGERVSGNWLLAKSEYASGTTPPFYIPMVICPTGPHALEKMMLLIYGRVRTSTSTVMPEWDTIQAAIPPNVIIWSGYQYNLKGELKPVPRDEYEDRSIPPPVLHIQDKKGTVLAAVQFLPWQDGAVIMTTGSFPVEMLLAYTDRSALKRASVFRRNGRQMSSVVPITRAEFTATLGRFQTQSNMVVRPDSTRVVIQKVRDEGTSSPFVARIFLGLLYLRNLALEDKVARDEFDRLHEVMTSHLFNARDAARGIEATWEGHRAKVASGECVRIDGLVTHITENVDRALRREVDSYLNASVRAIKEGAQRMTKYLNLDIGLLFVKQKTFEAKVAALDGSDPTLAAYLRQSRQWSEPLVQSRIALEHGSWTLPKITYTPNGTGMDVGEPMIAGQPMTDFVKKTFDRVMCFAEEITAYSIQRKLPVNITLTEMPVSKRTSEDPTRFLVTATNGGLPPWRLMFRSDTFENV
jgi:hypothetical protein